MRALLICSAAQAVHVTTDRLQILLCFRVEMWAYRLRIVQACAHKQAVCIVQKLTKRRPMANPAASVYCAQYLWRTQPIGQHPQPPDFITKKHGIGVMHHPHLQLMHLIKFRPDKAICRGRFHAPPKSTDKDKNSPKLPHRRFTITCERKLSHRSLKSG